MERPNSPRWHRLRQRLTDLILEAEAAFDADGRPGLEPYARRYRAIIHLLREASEFNYDLSDLESWAMAVARWQQSKRT